MNGLLSTRFSIWRWQFNFKSTLNGNYNNNAILFYSQCIIIYNSIHIHIYEFIFQTIKQNREIKLGFINFNVCFTDPRWSERYDSFCDTSFEILFCKSKCKLCALKIKSLKRITLEMHFYISHHLNTFRFACCGFEIAF